MLKKRPARFALAATALIAVSVTLLQAPVSSASDWQPTGAAAVYKWGAMQWRDEFEGSMDLRWSMNHPTWVEDRYGMLTLKGRQDGKPVIVTLDRHAHRYGRWEVRMRIRQWETQLLPYRLVTQLVPVGTSDHCGAKNIVMEDYVNGAPRAHMAIRTLPNLQFTYSDRPHFRNGGWSTFAVEVTRNHISWFADDHVVMTERRDQALSGTRYRLQFRFESVGGTQTTLRPPWMQMDWARHYDLHRPNVKSIAAPSATKTTYKQAC